jgi:hypothetical protein
MVICNGGRNQILNRIFKSTEAPSNFYIGLYTQTSEPVNTDTLGTVTELIGTGYSRIALAKSNWVISGSEASHPEITFTAGANWGNVYGYFICDVESGTSGNLYFVEHFLDGPYYVLDTGNIHITPVITSG